MEKLKGFFHPVNFCPHTWGTSWFPCAQWDLWSNKNSMKSTLSILHRVSRHSETLPTYTHWTNIPKRRTRVSRILSQMAGMEPSLDLELIGFIHIASRRWSNRATSPATQVLFSTSFWPRHSIGEMFLPVTLMEEKLVSLFQIPVMEIGKASCHLFMDEKDSGVGVTCQSTIQSCYGEVHK